LSDLAITVLIGIVMLIGLVGSFLPIVPDIILIWLAALGYGILQGWGTSGPWLFGLITILAIAGLGMNLIGHGIGGKLGGASWPAILGGLLFGLAGFVLFPPFGAIIGLLAGTFAIELLRKREPEQALRGVLGIGVGFGASYLANILLSIGMVGAWLVWVFSS
jgi:uncharacterized protein YqgC (DUF456 family)